MAKRPAYPNHVGTIGDKIRMGHGLWVHCENRECPHRARVDLEAVAERYGAELSVAEFVNKSVCSECRARWPNISISLEPDAPHADGSGLPISMDGSNISLEGPVIRWMSAMDYARPRDAPGRWA